MKIFTSSLEKYARRTFQFGVLFSLLFLTLLSQSFAQTPYSRVYATNQTSGVTEYRPFTVLLGIGTVTTPTNATTNGTLAERGTAAVLNATGLLATSYINLKFDADVPVGTSIHVKLSSDGNLLGIGNGLTVQSVNSSDAPIGTSQQLGNLISLLDGVNQYEFIYTTTLATTRGLRITYAPTVSLLSGGISVYGAYYKTAASNIACDTPDDELHGVSGLASTLAGVVTNPLNAIDNNINTASVLNSVVGVAGYAQQTAVFTSEAAAGDSVKVLVQRPATSILDAQLLGSVRVITYLGNTIRNQDGTGSLLTLRLLPGTTNKYYISYKTTLSFDRIEVRLGGTLNVLTSLNIFEIQRTPGAPVVAPSSQNVTIYAGQTATLTATTSVAADGVTWFTSATGTGVASTSKTFTTPALTATTYYYVGTTRNGCTDASLRAPAVVTVLPLTITNPVNGKTGQPYNGVIVATSPNKTFTYVLASGSSLPAGLTLNPNGTITGTIAGTVTPGPKTFDVVLTDNNGVAAGTRTYTLQVDPGLALATATLSPAQVGTAYTSAQLPAATNGTGTITYTANGPFNGLAFNPATRVISGTPTAPGTVTFTVTATDQSNPVQTTTQTYSVTIGAATLVQPSATLASGQVSVPYSATIPEATGGTGTKTYSASPLPAGLTFDPATRVISGTPTTPGTTNVVVTVTDQSSPAQSVTQTYPITVNAGLNQPAATLASGQVSVPYSATIPEATGGTGTKTYSASPLPAGLTFDPATRVISGTPTTPGTTNVVVTVTDQSSPAQSVTQTYPITVNAALAQPAATLASGQVSVPYSATIPEATGGTGTKTYSASPLPAGLSFDPATRIISGTPTTPGTTNVVVTVTDQSNPAQSTTQTYPITIAPATLAQPAATLASGQVGTTYSATIPEATGGTGTKTYSASPLPAGLTFDPATRTISGTPTTPGTTNVVVTVTDQSSPAQTATQTYPITINAGLNQPAATLASGQVSVPYSATIPEATGGTGTKTYSASPLPAGLTFDPATRTISGTPTTPGTTNVVVTVTDQSNPAQTATQTYPITINAALAQPTATLPSGQVGTSYSATIPEATGGTGTKTYTASPLPAGLTFNPATRTISGLPTSAGTTSVTVTVTDESSPAQTATQTYSITINAAVAVLDLSPTTDIDNLDFSGTTTSRDFVVYINTQNSTATTAPVTFVISKISAFDITFSPTNGTSQVDGGTPNQNANWSVADNGNFLILTSKSGVVIPGNSSAIIGFTITRKANIPPGTTQNITVGIIGGTGGGEAPTNNNTVVTSVSTN